MKVLVFVFLFSAFLQSIDAATKQFAFNLDFNYKAHLGHRRPYHHPPNPGLSNSLPDGCEIVQVQALIRHGARNPTGSEWPSIDRLTKILKSKKISVDPRLPDNPFTFLDNWKPFLQKTSVDLLSMTGRTQAFSLGESFVEHYAFTLLNTSHKYNIEYGDQYRVEETARWFAMGFWGINSTAHVTFEGIPETPASGARSLQQYESCPNFSQHAEKQRRKYESHFLPQIKDRLNKFIRGYKFTEDDITNLYEICAYEDAVTGADSHFCQLFTPQEFLAFEYLDDIWFQQFDGPANKFSEILGAPWVQRMAERLRSNSSTKLHFSFGHDVTILPVMTAMGLFPASAYKPLGTHAIEWSRSFRGGNHVPFCGNIIVEKLQCEDADYVRVLNNQVPVPLEGCGVGPSGFTDGLCEVGKFLNQSIRRKAVESGVEWFEKKCGLKDIVWQA